MKKLLLLVALLSLAVATFAQAAIQQYAVRDGFEAQWTDWTPTTGYFSINDDDFKEIEVYTKGSTYLFVRTGELKSDVEFKLEDGTYLTGISFKGIEIVTGNKVEILLYEDDGTRIVTFRYTDGVAISYIIKVGD